MNLFKLDETVSLVSQFNENLSSVPSLQYWNVALFQEQAWRPRPFRRYLNMHI